MTDWIEVIKDNEEKIEEAMAKSYKDSFECQTMQFDVCVEPDGNIYVHEETAGSTFMPKSVWDGIDIVIKTYCNQYADLSADEIEYEIEEYKPFEDLKDFIEQYIREHTFDEGFDYKNAKENFQKILHGEC